jgi:hypothetical protein
MRTSRNLIFAILVVTVPLVVVSPALAQGTDSGVGVGVLGGFTRTSVVFENDVPDALKKSGSGVIFGIWFGGNRDGRVGFMGELDYVIKKAEIEGSEEELHYLEIPAVFRINMGSRSRSGASVYIIAGPVFDIRVKAKEDGEEVDSPEDLYQGLDIGILGGAGVEFYRIGVEVRHSWGVRSVLQPDVTDFSGLGKTQLNTLQILGKIRFN